MLPGIPLMLQNFLLSMLNISNYVFFFSTLIGSTPIILFCVLIGNKIHNLKDIEANLIERTMGQITKEFPGISFCTIYPNTKKTKKNKDFFQKAGELISNKIYKIVVGKRDGLTIIGPATIIKDIRKNPSQIDLFIQ